jgi:hypothetical protein
MQYQFKDREFGLLLILTRCCRLFALPDRDAAPTASISREGSTTIEVI